MHKCGGKPTFPCFIWWKSRRVTGLTTSTSSSQQHQTDRVCAEGHWEPRRTVSTSVLSHQATGHPPALRPDSRALPPSREDDCEYEDWGHTSALFQFQSLVTHHLPHTETSGNLSAKEYPAVTVFWSVTQPSPPSALAGEGRRAAGKNWSRSFVTQRLPKLTGKKQLFY